MPSQRALVIVASFAASLALTLGVILWIASDSKRPALLGPAAIGGAFELVDQTGAKVTEQALIGKPTIIFFGFTHCPDVCPTSLFEMSEVLRAMGKDADKINAYFVSVDPERDTPAVMKDYLGSFDPRLKGLSGSRQATDKIIAAYRVFAKKIPLQGDDYTMDHTALIYLMGKDGKFVAPFNLKRQPEDAATDLKRYL